MPSNTKQSAMAPVAGVKFLSVQDKLLDGGSLIQARSTFVNVREPLLLIDDQIVHDLQIFGLRCTHEVIGSVVVRAAIVHVHVEVAAYPTLAVRMNCGKAAQTHNHLLLDTGSYFDAGPLNSIFKALH